MDTLQIGFQNFNFLWRISIYLKIQLICKSCYIDRLRQVWLCQCLLISCVKCIGQVFKSYEDFIPAYWEESITTFICKVFAEFLWELKQFLILFVYNWLFDSTLVIETEEILQWLLNINLLLTLKRLAFICIKYLHIVTSIYTNTQGVTVSLVDSCVKIIAIFHQYSSLLHQFNGCGTR